MYNIYKVIEKNEGEKERRERGGERDRGGREKKREGAEGGSEKERERKRCIS